jgi:hypothetical protein
MLKFIEELESGDALELEGRSFIITSDFKKNGDRLCIDIATGNSRWIKSDYPVNLINLYTVDSNSNFMPIKEIKSDVSPQIKNVP